VDDGVSDGLEAFHFRDNRSGLEAEEVRKGQAEAASHADVKEITTARSGAEVQVVALAVGVHFHDL
jgi:hypothetical protein